MTAAALPRELDGALDALIERFGHDEHRAGVAAARLEYAERTGRVFEEDEVYEARTVAFLEWYALERPLADGRAPVEAALADEADGERAAALRAWATSHRSVFAIEKVGADSLRLLDLWGGARFEVDERRRLHGVARGDVIEARLLAWRDRVRFGRTFLFHPGAARVAIHKRLARMRAAGHTRAEGTAAIAALQVKALRWKHVEVVRVYAGER
jgi:hypothetical protein